MKHIKMVLYGEPGVGKSVFATKAPKPFFITTDGNYEFLEEFGAKEKDHVQVNSWAEAKKVFDRKFEEYETIVVDLTEDLFKWCEYEYCRRNGYEHVSDIGFGKGYDITRNEFFINLCKLLNLNKNVILIMHGLTYTVKDRRGVEHTKYGPTNRLPDKVLDMIEGRVRYFLRAYSKAQDEGGKLITKRYLSLVPKENEYGILRGINDTTIPTDISLDFNLFASVIGLETNNKITFEDIQKLNEQSVDKPTVKTEKVEKVEKVEEIKQSVNVVDINKDVVIKEQVVQPEKEEVKVDEPQVQEEQQVQVEPQKTLSREDKLAAIRAKMAAKRNV